MPATAIAPTEVGPRHLVSTEQAVDVINQMPHLPRLVLLFAYCEGMTMQEIGRSLGVDEARVRTMHDEALRQLRLALAC
jgi:DNA-directed RNA polymerase specialized sigma subunit